MFLIDVESYMYIISNAELQGVVCAINAASHLIYMYLKIFVLLYADDTVILAESLPTWFGHLRIDFSAFH